MLWPFAVTHCAECQLREFLEEPECKFEFGSIVLVWVKEPLDSWEPRYRKTVFLGYAPDVSSGYFVMHMDGKIEVTSNLKPLPTYDVSGGPVAAATEETENQDPFREVLDGGPRWTCPACNGHHRRHTKDVGCRQGPHAVVAQIAESEGAAVPFISDDEGTAVLSTSQADVAPYASTFKPVMFEDDAEFEDF